MLNLPLIHPQLLAALGRSGHGSRILLADGNYPHITGSPVTATRIYLNLRPGLLLVEQVLEVLVEVIPIEAATVMQPQDGTDAPAFATYRRMLSGMPLARLDRLAFYQSAREASVSTVIATGDTQHYSNLLITIGAL